MSEQCKAYKLYPDFKVTKPEMINKPFINSIRGLELTILQCSDWNNFQSKIFTLNTDTKL